MCSYKHTLSLAFVHQDRLGSQRDKGDVHTGDGIERVSDVESLLTPFGGEGGSVPQQALGSKAEERAKRRKAKKDSYAQYLESATWKKIRGRALRRDKHKCRACGGRALVVHHVRYPKNLGEEKMEWLYSLCAPCHDSIHRAATSMTLREATDLILGAERNGKITRLPDDPRLTRSAAKARHRKKMKHHPRTAKKRKKVQSLHVSADRKKKSKIDQENDRLHAIFKQNKERRRERRRSA